MKAVFTLKSAESRRLLAKAVLAMPEVKVALNSANVILAGGTTNAFIAQELLGKEGISPELCTVGVSTDGLVCVTDPDSRKMFPVVYKKGVPMPDMTIRDALNDFSIDSVVIKGANAVDPDGNVGVITSGFDGGTIPVVLGTVTSTGLKMITPVGLEKLVPSVKEACKAVGARRIDISLGADFGMYHLATTEVVTEIEALDILFGLKATLVAAGGIGGNEGAVLLSVDGDEDKVKACVEFIENEVKGEPPVPGNKGTCETCRYRRCRYCGKKAEELPAWLR